METAASSAPRAAFAGAQGTFAAPGAASASSGSPPSPQWSTLVFNRNGYHDHSVDEHGAPAAQPLVLRGRQIRISRSYGRMFPRTEAGDLWSSRRFSCCTRPERTARFDFRRAVALLQDQDPLAHHLEPPADR